MITLLEGTPGSGKSYHAVSNYFLPWVRANRRIYIAVDGIYLDRLAVFENRTVEDLEKQITVWNDSASIPSLLLSVEPGSAVILDEAQTIFRAKEKTSSEVLRWLETHRHIGVDVLMMAQNYKQLTSGVTRLVEVTIKFRRAERLGLKKVYQGFIRGNPEETEVISRITGTYKPTVYAYYSSYSVAAITEERKVRTLFQSPFMILAGLILLVTLGWWTFGDTHPGLASQIAKEKADKLPPPVKRAELDAMQAVLDKPSPAGQNAAVILPTAGIRVEGGMTVGEKTYWVDAKGRILSADQIAGITGKPVTETRRNGVPVLVGDGITWGGEEREVTTVDRFQESLPDRGEPEESPVLETTETDTEKKPAVLCVTAAGEQPCESEWGYAGGIYK